MKRRAQRKKNGFLRAVWSAATGFGLLSGLSMAAFGRLTRKQRKSRRLRQHDMDHPGFSGDERLIEPLGANIAWGQLDQLGGKYTGVPYLLTRQIIILGRQADCDIILDDDRASRYHAFLTWDHGRGYVRDNGSLNGTTVNGQAAKAPMVLRHGDIIAAGGSEFRFSYAEATGLALLDAQPTEKIALPGILAHTPEATPVLARLTALTGPEAGRMWPVVAGVITIGRGGDNLVVLPHPSVSRHHAQIIVQPAGLFVQDIGSSNRASVNGETLTAPRLLADNDHIQIGDILLVLKMEHSTATAPQPELPEDEPTQRLPTAGLSSPSASGFSQMRRAALTRPGIPHPNRPPPDPAAPSMSSQSLPQFRRPLPTHPLPPGSDAARRLPRFRPPEAKDEEPRGESS